MIELEDFKRLFDYIEIGGLIWKVKVSDRINIGDIAGTPTKDGYRSITIYGKRYKEHKIIYIMHYGKIPEGMQIDHINRIRDDNRIENLRLVTDQENRWNRSAKGYSWDKKSNKWRSYIGVNGKIIRLGSFDNEEDASNVYLNAKKQYHIIPDRS